MNPKVDFFFNKDTKWQVAYMRSIILDCGLTEELKWGIPCYTFHKNNVVLLHGFKEYCALLFHKGALLKDVKGILIQQTENVQAARQIRFTSLREIMDMETVIKAYIYQAIEVEKAGLKVELEKTLEYTVPEEFQMKLDEDPGLKNACKKLTPGRQRACMFFFSQAKQAKTRLSRIEINIPQILHGKGLNES